MAAISLFFLLFVTGITGANFCPAPEDVAPCTYFSGSYRDDFTELILQDFECKNIFTPAELFPPIQALARCSIKGINLKIINSSLLYLPENLFQNTPIAMITFRDTELISFSESDIAFAGLEDTLVSLHAHKIKSASHWDFNQLRNLHELFVINLSQVFLGAIDYPFPHLPKLHSLQIRSAGITYVADDAFSNLSNAKTIVMSYNDVTELKRTMFPNPANNLRNLDLRKNKLSYLPRDFFDNMPALSRVFLMENKLTTLAEKPFSVAFRKLHHLSLTGNPIRCDCRMHWLVNIRFPRIFRGTCSSPAALTGRSIKDLDYKSLWC